MEFINKALSVLPPLSQPQSARRVFQSVNGIGNIRERHKNAPTLSEQGGMNE
jgi:hypothetical protein